MKLNDKIAILRKSRHLTQEEFGDSFGDGKEHISRQTVSKWETDTTTPTLENVFKMKEILNVSFDALLDEDIDLSNKDVLAKVLSNEGLDQKERKTTSTMHYKFYRFDKRKDLITTIVIAAICLVGTVVGSLLLSLSFLWLTLTAFCGAGFLVSIIFVAVITANFVKGKGQYCGSLCYSTLKLTIQDESENKIEAPYENVEKFEVTNVKKNKTGDLTIKIKDHSREIVYKDIINAAKLKEYYKYVQTFKKGGMLQKDGKKFKM